MMGILGVLGIVAVVVGFLGLFHLISIGLPISMLLIVGGLLIAVYSTGRLGGVK